MQPKQEQNRIRINHYIRVPKVKVLNEQEDFIGEMDTRDALRMAQEQGVDLVEVNGKSYPPLVQLISIGKFKYIQKRKEAEARKNQKVVDLKELYAHPNTEMHDLSRQADQARKFLSEGHKVKFVIKMRGREVGRPEIALEKIVWVIDQLRDISEECPPPQIEGRNMQVVFYPAKKSK